MDKGATQPGSGRHILLSRMLYHFCVLLSRAESAYHDTPGCKHIIERFYLQAGYHAFQGYFILENRFLGR